MATLTREAATQGRPVCKRLLEVLIDVFYTPKLYCAAPS